jgi:signal transduction histidine kinase
VQDSGIGIPPAERALVLQRFYRSDKSRHIGGSGLGLSLVAAIAALHDARIAVLDGPGGAGTVFAVHFPAEHATL